MPKDQAGGTFVLALCLSLSPYQTLCPKPFFVNGYVAEGKCINVALLCLHPLSKKFDFCWTRFREFEPKKEGRRINTVCDSSHLFSFILVHHIKAPEISPRGFLSRKHPPYAWERLFEGLPRFPKLPHVEYEHFIT